MGEDVIKKKGRRGEREGTGNYHWFTEGGQLIVYITGWPFDKARKTKNGGARRPYQKKRGLNGSRENLLGVIVKKRNRGKESPQRGKKRIDLSGKDPETGGKQEIPNNSNRVNVQPARKPK